MDPSQCIVFCMVIMIMGALFQGAHCLPNPAQEDHQHGQVVQGPPTNDALVLEEGNDRRVDRAADDKMTLVRNS